MGNVKASGSIIAGPVTSGDDVFPGVSANMAITTNPNPKAFQVATGAIPRNLQSAVAYTPLEGLPTTVSKGNFLYFRCTSPIMVRATFQGSPNIVSEIPIQGIMFIEIPDTSPLIALEAKGTGFIEYFVSGNQLSTGDHTQCLLTAMVSTMLTLTFFRIAFASMV